MEFNATEVAALLSLPEKEVREWARAGKLPHLDAQGRLRFNRQAILEWALACGHSLNFGAVEEEAAGLPPIAELFTPQRFHYGVPGRSFAEVFRAALEMFELPAEADKELIYDLLVSREKLMTTAIGDGLAIPHLRVPLVANVPRPTLGVFFTCDPIDMGALDGTPVHTLFVLLSLTPKQHLELLARLAFVFRQPDFVKLLRERAKAETICEWIQRASAEEEMITLFVIGLLLHGLNLLLPAFVRDSRRLNVTANLLNAAALLCGLSFSLSALLSYQRTEYRFELPAAGPVIIGFDGLSLFFLFTFQLLSLAASLYAIGYLRHYIERGLSVRGHLCFFTLLIVSLQLLVIAHNALALLIMWEFMAVGAYFSIVFDKDKAEVRRGGFWYFVATHAGVLLLYVCFLTLHELTGGWNFDDIARHAAYDPKALAIVLLTGFAGFGIKCGFMPFHVWLPNAHPAAPAHISGLLSAINIKTGIYGIARLMLMLPALDPAYGWGLLAVSLVSAVFGVWYALAQHDIKRLLAYHSVENIGIIGLGLSVAWLGRCYALPELVVLGFAGALLHTLNHAIFKGLLFFGAGHVDLHAHTCDIEKMGGFTRVIPLTSLAFLVGAISICGLPPFNGFASEFLIYKSFFRAGDLLRDYAPLVLLVAAVGLAFMGGLAVACFTKLYGIVFLGVNRSGAAPKRQGEPLLSSVALFGLAGLCAMLGILPQTGLRLIAPVLGELASAAQAPADWAAPLGQLQMAFALFVALVTAVYVAKLLMQRRSGVRLRETWGCGYAAMTPRMQYTASGFAEELVKLGRPMLALVVQWTPLRKIVPIASAFRSRCDDRMESTWQAFNRAVGRFLGAFRWIQSGNIRHYVLYTFGAVLFYLLCALVW